MSLRMLTEPKYSTEAIHPSHHNTHQRKAQIFRRIGCTTIYICCWAWALNTVVYPKLDGSAAVQLSFGTSTSCGLSRGLFYHHLSTTRSHPAADIDKVSLGKRCHSCHYPTQLSRHPRTSWAKGTREVVLPCLPGLLPLADRYHLLFRAHDAVPH
ncbi:hypothetical protein BKA82DRAFT_765093 [Pisolithus tinctorius]|uniref:Uncharacterized protein n=1 Tax=Pisolithus tinctorius Marx 270 TaxID=870435 RepID=A0A0C3JRX1_PISTI|nr:hypothetical protein BKA82DRAFT_765093 [Pisolithus tinctorius]KIO00232.1 hypothetical protein M404DRAFT_765093 [Pisolithus tinctorius Marx 270]